MGMPLPQVSPLGWGPRPLGKGLPRRSCPPVPKRQPAVPRQVGIFRKSGVKSRIQALRHMNETSPDNVNYEGQSAYDVADLLKQYFRDLPEPIFTSKLTDTFLQIYQCECWAGGGSGGLLAGGISLFLWTGRWCRRRPAGTDLLTIVLAPRWQSCRRSSGCRRCKRP